MVCGEMHAFFRGGEPETHLKKAPDSQCLSHVLLKHFDLDSQLKILFTQKHTDICHTIIKSSLIMK